MSDIWIQTQNLLEQIEKPTSNISINNESNKKDTWIPEYLQNQVQDILQETRDKKELELKIEQIYIALENMYPDFNRTNFIIKDSMIWEEYDTYCLYSKKWQLLSYIKSNWETILDMKKFKPFKDSLDRAFKNWVWIDYIKKSNWKWYLLLTSDNWEIKEYVEWSKKFNVAVTPD